MYCKHCRQQHKRRALLALLDDAADPFTAGRLKMSHRHVNVIHAMVQDTQHSISGLRPEA